VFECSEDSILAPGTARGANHLVDHLVDLSELSIQYPVILTVISLLCQTLRRGVLCSRSHVLYQTLDRSL